MCSMWACHELRVPGHWRDCHLSDSHSHPLHIQLDTSSVTQWFKAIESEVMYWVLMLLLAVLTVIIIRWAMADYRRWVALGVGGLPHTPAGWLAMGVLRLLKRDGIKAVHLKRHIQSNDDHQYLGQVMKRSGQRPLVPAYAVPQRQLTQTISVQHLEQLKSVFDTVVQIQADQVQYQQSFYEKHNEAITLCHPDCGHAYGLISHGEVAHIHPVDGSMHMVLSPSDAAKVIEAGWGELHGLAGFMNRLPVSYTFVYAPRDEQEIDVVRQLLDAAVAHMTEQRQRVKAGCMA
jgi:Family of unknown function (DUF5519)